MVAIQILLVLQYPTHLIVTKGPESENARGGEKRRANNIGQRRQFLSGCIQLMIWDISQQLDFPRWEHQHMMQDGQQKYTSATQQGEIYQLTITLGIIYYMGVPSEKGSGEGGTMRPETYQIQMTNIVGMIFLLECQDQVMLAISWEQMNQAQYQQVTMQSQQSGMSLSAGLKYFQQSAQSTGIMQLGIAQIYKHTGTTNLDFQKAILIDSEMGEQDKSIVIGLLLIFVTLSFKQGVGPFHQWAPDQYDSLPTILTFWMAVQPKQTQQIFLSIISKQISNLEEIIIILGISSQLIGSLGQGYQWKIKRFFAWSAIGQVGYLYQTYTTSGTSQYVYYLVLYGIISFLIFCILVSVNQTYVPSSPKIRQVNTETKESESGRKETVVRDELKKIEKLEIDDQKGQAKDSPIQGKGLTLSIFSLGGIPPTVGFYAKQKVQLMLTTTENTILLIYFVIFSSIAVVNYQTQIKVLNFDTPLGFGHYTQGTVQSYIIAILLLFLVFFNFSLHSSLLALSMNLMDCF